MNINQGESSGEHVPPFSQGQLDALQSMIEEAIAGAIPKTVPPAPQSTGKSEF